MRIIFFFLTLFCLASVALASSSGRVVYLNQRHSMIDWDKLVTDEWTDFDLWKKEIYLKSQIDNWRQVLREKRLKESVGRVLQCVGECYIESGEGVSNSMFRSNINELEDFKTGPDSYAWIFLYDGSMVRVSPESSIAFKEINIGVKENFFHARINYGNVLWLSRNKSILKDTSGRETDTLFLPLDFYDANPKTTIPEVDESDLFKYLEENSKVKSRFALLNELIVENNKFAEEKNTKVMIVMPNGTVLGDNLSMEFIVLIGGKSYFKQRSSAQLGLGEDADRTNVECFFRGFENYESISPEEGKWYEISESGRSIETAGVSVVQKFGMGEFVTKRIPTVLIARELLIKKYSHFAFAKLTRLELARDYGYRMWDTVKGKSRSEIGQRIEYLKEYTRRMETTNILASKNVDLEYSMTDDRRRGSVYSNKFYQRAINTYFRRGDGELGEIVDFRELNSTRRPLWKRIHAIR